MEITDLRWHKCTPEDPWTPTTGKRGMHPDAEEVDGSQRDGYPGGDTVKMRCPTCGAEWREELPQ